MPKEMKRIDGHVCQPLVEWIRQKEESMPKGWGGKERCLPDKSEQVELMQNQMLGIHRHIRRRVLEGLVKQGSSIEVDWASEGWEDGIEAVIREERWANLWERWVNSRPNAME